MSEFFSLCIERLPNCYSVSLGSGSALFTGPAGRAFREHISRAHPTQMIFHLLRSIPSESEFLVRFPGVSELHTLEIIIKWLQVSVSECNRQTLQTKKSNCI